MKAPLRLALGLGCDRGTPLATVQICIQRALAQLGADLQDVVAVATIAAKADEPAFQALAAQRGWVLRHYSAAQLAAVTVPNPSDTVLRHMGTPSVSEAAALLAAGADLSALLVEKHKWRGADGKNATVSIARVPVSPASPGSASPCSLFPPFH
ncbi:MAG: cobalamin biosynthesis protein [Ramlibacter sp.]